MRRGRLSSNLKQGNEKNSRNSLRSCHFSVNSTLNIPVCPHKILKGRQHLGRPILCKVILKLIVAHKVMDVLPKEKLHLNKMRENPARGKSRFSKIEKSYSYTVSMDI